LQKFEEDAGGGPVAVEKVLEAFFEPMIEGGSRSPQFVKVMGRMYAEGMLPTVVAKHFQPTLMRFVQALRRSLPSVPDGEITSRMQFMIGAMSHAVCGTREFSEITGQGGVTDFPATMRRLMTFLSAGLQAPATPEGHE
jgi:hypothetical protein